MALLSPQVVTITGTTPTYSTPSSSDTIKFSGANSFLIVKNASGSPINVTVVVPGTKHGQNNPDVVVAVPATTGERWIGPFTNDMTDVNNLVTVNYSATTSVTAALVHV